jgi:hypothetical protein
MADFIMKIAGVTGRVTSLFDSTKDYCRDYLSEGEPAFHVTVCRENLDFEQWELDREAIQEGLRCREFSDPFLERTAIQRAFAEYLVTQDVLMIHGSTVAVDGKGYLFTAKCGTGKSTHTRLWREVFGSRAVMVNDDKPFVAVTREEILVCGAPWSGKHGLHSNITVPLQGICILERGAENRIRRITPEEAREMLLHQSYCPMEPEKRSSFQRCMEEVLRRVPLWKMECNKDPQAACVAWEAMHSEETEMRL